MRASLIAILAILYSSTFSQNLEVEGKVKINTLDRNDLADSVLVKLVDGTLGIRVASSLKEIQVISISNDTIFLSDGGFVKLPQDVNAGWTLDSNGTTTGENVGIGISVPTSKFHLKGNAKIRGSLDLSEMIDTTSLIIGINSGDHDYAYLQNTFVGTQAGESTSYGNANSFYGYQSGKDNSTGQYNSFFGVESGLKNLTGGGNSLFGYNSGIDNETGHNNSFYGIASGHFNTSGDGNSFFGARAGLSNNGRNNSAFGNSAGAGISTGHHNSFVGYYTGALNFGGAYNSCMGANAGYYNKGDRNSFFGAWAGSTNVTGRNLTCIGANSQPSTNSTNHEITLGNDSIQSLRCNATSITSLSDRRDKTDIQDLSVGIDFIMSLQPRQYRWDRRDWYTDQIRDGTQKASEFTAGFIAQELDQAQTTQDAEWLNLVMKNNPERLEATPGNLLPVIVKSLQDLKIENDQLRLHNIALEQSVEALKAEIGKIRALLNNVETGG